MSDLFEPVRAAVRIEVPEQHRLPIAIIGAGEIVDLAHLPAYRKHGLEIVGITDINQARAREVAERHGIPRVYGSNEEVAADPDVVVVDIAVFPWAQYEVGCRCSTPARTCCARNRFPTTTQKPSGWSRTPGAKNA